LKLTRNVLDEWTPAWSHNGQRIVFASGGNSNQQIYVMNIDGSGQTRLTNDAFNEWAPAWSPDDNKIVFASDRDGKSQLYVMNADGSGLKRLDQYPQ
jgi:Tol biopolymer transport system component